MSGSLQGKVYGSNHGTSTLLKQMGHYNAPTKRMGIYNSPARKLGHYLGTGSSKSNISGVIHTYY